ncbi:MAG: deoxyribonuclease IV [Gemmataceae bacterium]
MPLLGAHFSIAGGFGTALREAAAQGCPALQIFTKPPNQWNGRPIRDEEAEAFRLAMPSHGIELAVAHDSYLINLASPDEGVRQRSIEAFAQEIARAELLGLAYLVMHPGSHLGAGEQAGLQRVIASFRELFQRPEVQAVQVRVLVENTAGQGTNLGHRLEHLATILDAPGLEGKLGVCFDTCHAFAAGYDLRTAEQYTQIMKELDQQVGRERVRVFHVNDSVRGCGSRVDRHAGLGRGEIGLEAFRCLINDPWWQDRPFLLETPKSEEGNEEMDAVNLGILREMHKKSLPQAVSA